MNAGSAIGSETVAVVGMGLVVPGAGSPTEFWQLLNIAEDRNFLTEPTNFAVDNWYSKDPTAADKSYVKVSGFINDFTPHPRLRQEIQAGRWRGVDRHSVLLRHVALQAMTTPTVRSADRVSCVVATMSGSSLGVEEALLLAMASGVGEPSSDDGQQRVRQALADHYRNAVRAPRESFTDRLARQAVGDLVPDGCQMLGVDSACSSSLYAVDLGVKAIMSDKQDVVLCAAVSCASRRDMVLFSKVKGLTATGSLRAFDAEPDGVLFADAAAVIVLKRLDRALADGDEVLGLLGGCGKSVDGVGTLVAPDLIGQQKAVTRAWSVNDFAPDRLDWIVGHGTGTREGDAVELEALAGLAAARGHLLTSNKPLTGHCGWASGMVSVIHVLLALRNETIPAQRFFDRLPDSMRDRRLTVPKQAQPWPIRQGDRRVAAVCAYGFGGTNAHVLIEGPEQSPVPLPRSARPPVSGDPMVLVGWETHLPGALDRQATLAWLCGDHPGPPTSFGEQYPAPPMKVLRMPPVAARSIDRAQLMALQVSAAFVDRYGELWTDVRDKTGVIAAQMGPGRGAAGYMLRAGADDVLAAAANLDDADRERVTERVERMRRRIPVVDEYSLPGQTQNIAASQIAKRFRFSGASFLVDCGRSSTEAALHAAQQHLATGELDMALVLAVNGESTPMMRSLVGPDGLDLAEGAVLLALTRATVAQANGWPVLAELSTAPANGSVEHAPPSPPADGTSYLGADGAFALLRVLASRMPKAVLRNADPGPRVLVKTPTRNALTRSAVTLRRADAIQVNTPEPVISRGCLLLVGSEKLTEHLRPTARRAGAEVVCTSAAESPASMIEAAVTRLGTLRRLVVVASAHESPRWPAPPPPALRRLQDCLLLAAARTTPDGGTVTALLLDPLHGHTTNPHLTLITGFLRALAHELPGAVCAVVSDADIDKGLEQLSAESAARRDRTIVTYRQGIRYVEHVCPAPLRNMDDDTTPWREGAVVVATGGARGATAVAVGALAKACRPHLWLLGTTPLHSVPEDLQNIMEQDERPARREYLARQLRATPDVSVRTLNRRFDELLRVREIETTLSTLGDLCGSDHVHYRTCDIRNRTDVDRLAKEIYAHEGQVDVVIHGAGRIASAAVTDKSIEDFHTVIDTKVDGYHHLLDAFADPAPALWCNFGSLSGLYGMAGDTDYTAANEYLTAAARYQQLVQSPTTELTLNWGLWTDTGMVSGLADHLRSTKQVGAVDNEQGGAQFRRELAMTRPAERAPLIGLANESGRHGPPATRLLDGPTTSGPDRLEFTWSPDPHRDAYVTEHLFDGRPLLPAVMMLAMAAEAGCQLTGHPQVRAFIDARIGEPVYTDSAGHPVLCRVMVVRLTPERSRVTIQSDLTTTDGRVLRKDRDHCQVDVETGEPGPGPATKPPPTTLGLLDDTTMRPDVSVQLSGVWRTLSAHRAGDAGATARWLPKLRPDDVFVGLPIPALLLDSLLRMVAHVPLPDGNVQMSVPVGIERVDLYTTANDAALVAAHPEGLDLSYQVGDGQSVAAAGDGQVLAAVTGMQYHMVDIVPLIQANVLSHKTNDNGQAPRSTSPDGMGIEVVVTAADTSFAGPVYYARLIDWQGLCREQCGLIRTPELATDMVDGYAILTQSCSCEYLKELWYGDHVHVGLTITRVRMNVMEAKFSYHRLAGDKPELVARGRQLWVSTRRRGSEYDPCGWPSYIIDTAAELGADISYAQRLSED